MIIAAILLKPFVLHGSLFIKELAVAVNCFALVLGHYLGGYLRSWPLQLAFAVLAVVAAALISILIQVGSGVAGSFA